MQKTTCLAATLATLSVQQFHYYNCNWLVGNFDRRCLECRDLLALEVQSSLMFHWQDCTGKPGQTLFAEDQEKVDVALAHQWECQSKEIQDKHRPTSRNKLGPCSTSQCSQAGRESR